MRGHVHHADSPALAALRARGYLGLEHRPSGGVWVPDRRVYSPPLGWRAPAIGEIPKSPYWRGPHLAATKDATSNIFIPQSSGEWSGFSNGVATPDALWLMQEASGNLADSIGSFTLTKNGSTSTYANTITGWSTKGLGTPDNASNSWSSSSASLPDASTTSMTVLLYAIINATPAANRNFMTFATSDTCSFRITATPRFAAHSGANVTNGTVDPTGAVRVYIYKLDRTGGTTVCYSSQEKLTVTTGSLTGKLFRFGGNSGSANPPNANYLYGAAWFSTNAEMSDQTIATLVDNLGWTRQWSVAFTAGLSETVNESESLGVVYSIPLALTETVTAAESAAALAALAVPVAETVTETEDVTPSMAITYGVSETVTEAEALADGPMQANIAAAETVTEADALAAAQGIAVALSESVAVAEALTALLGAVAALAEEVDSVEALVTAMQAVIAAAEEVDAAEALDALLAANVPLAESLAALVVIGAVQGVAIALAEAVGETETILAALQAVIPLAESGALLEALAASLGIQVALDDDTTIGETVTALRSVVVALAESVGAGESLSAHYATAVALAESVGVAEVLRILNLAYVAALRALRGYVTGPNSGEN